MKSKKLAVFIAVLATFGQYLPTMEQSASARGGGGGFGGGHGFYGGGMRMGGDFDRGDFDRAFDRGAYDTGENGLNHPVEGGHEYVGFDHPAANHLENGVHQFDSTRPSEADLRANANMEYGPQRALSTDGGFGRIATAGQISDYQRVGHNTYAVSRENLALRGDAIRDGYRYPDAFDRGWWGRYPVAWGYAGWGGGWAWGYTGWPALAGLWGMSAAAIPLEYDFGTNITYQNDNVYYGSQSIESASAYYGQAQTLAQSITPSSSSSILTQSQAKNWKPLGVFSLTQGTETNTTTMFQLAVNKKGAIGGNYYNTLTQEAKPVHGAIDKKIMRAAWTVDGNKDVVYDTGMANLLQPQSTILVHMGKSLTQQWNLIRLKQPKAKSTT